MTDPRLSWDLVADLQQLFAYPFMVHAILAGTIVAVLSAVVGWYMLLRHQVFAGHTVSVMAFPGAAGAALLGLPSTVGYYLACTSAALVLGRARDNGIRAQTAQVGTVQAVGLAAGFLFLSLHRSVLSDPEDLLFGNILGVSASQVLVLAVAAVVALAALTAIGRRLLFATADREIARAAGVGVRALDAAFMVILAVAVAATSQITGALLVFSLLVAPPAAAQRLTLRPLAGLMIAVGLALAVVWIGLALAYFTPYPIGFYTSSLAFALYIAVRTARREA